MKRNTSPDFVGIEVLKKTHRDQLEFFESCAAANEWSRVHSAHYDWWMFPINRGSSYGLKWTVHEGDVEELERDPEFVKNYLRGVELQALAWGWDLNKAEYVQNPHPDQRWSNWPIRLWKCASSLRLFGFTVEFESMKKYAQHLINAGKDFHYRNRGLAELFTRE